MKKLRITTLFLLMAMLASCGADVTEGGKDTSSSDINTSGNAETGEYVHPGVTYGGETFTLLDYDTEEYSWQAASYSNIAAEEENGEPINDALYNRNLAVEEALDVTIDVYSVGGSNRKNNDDELQKLILAGDDLVDAAFLFANDMAGMLTEEGMLIDFGEVSTLNTEASWWNQEIINEMAVGGAQKVITGDISLYTAFSPQLLFMNKEVASQFKIDDCYDLVREGKWTYDKMIEYSSLVASDINGDTKMDQNDRYGVLLQGGLMSYTLNAGDVKCTVKNADGQPELSVYSPRSVNIVEKMAEFMTNANICCNANTYSSQYSNVFYEMFIPMFRDNQALFYWNQLLISFELRAMESDYGLLPLPKYDEAQENYFAPVNNSWAMLLAIPATNADLARTGHILDALGYYSQQIVKPEFIDTTIRHKSLRDEDSGEMLELILDHTTIDAALVYNWGKMYDLLNSLTSASKPDFASQYAKYESAIKTEMQKTFDEIKG